VPPRQSETLTEAELRIMHVLWGKGSGTVQQVLDSIKEKPLLAYNSVLTTIRVLERKGYLKHLKDGRAHVYTPLVGQQEATRSEIRHLVSRFFKDSHEQLVLNLLEDQGIGPEEITHLRRCWFRKTSCKRIRLRKTLLGATRNELARYADDDSDNRTALGRAHSECAARRIADRILRLDIAAVLRKQSSGTRFAVWFVALLMVAVLPLLGGFNVGADKGRTWPALGMAQGHLHSAITIPGSWALLSLSPGLWARAWPWHVWRRGSGSCGNCGGAARPSLRRISTQLCSERWKGSVLPAQSGSALRRKCACPPPWFLEADHRSARLDIARTIARGSKRHPAA